MKHFLAPDGEIYAYELDGSQDHLIPYEFVPLNDEELAAARQANEQKRVASLRYDEKRSFEYPPMQDYLDGIVKGDQAQIQKYIADCLAVKAKYPKPI